MTPHVVLATLASLTAISAFVLPATPWLSEDVRPLALAVSILWAGWRLFLLDRALAHWRAWHQSPTWVCEAAALATAEHEGVLLGKAFRWNAAHTQELETALAEAGALPIDEGSRGGHPALHAVGAREERPLHIPWSELRGQVLLTGTTGSGKTRLLEVLVSEVIRGGSAQRRLAAKKTPPGPGCVIVIDPKGDRDLLARCAAEAHRQGRVFRMIIPAFPAQSATMNILDTCSTPAEVSARIRALMPSGGAKGSDPFFEEYPLALVERLATVQQALGIPWTLEGLYSVSVLRNHMEGLLTQYLVHLGYHGGGKLSGLIGEYRKSGKVDLVADALIDDLEKPRDHFTKVTSNLIPAFRGVIGAPLGPLFSTIPADITWRTIVDESMVVYVGLASMLLGDIANRIGRVILQDLVGYLGRRYAYDPVESFTPITVLIDEFGDVAYPLFTNALNKGGAAQARFLLAQQSLADAEAAMGEPQARRVYDNCNTRIYARLADDRTAAEATEGLGLCTVQLPETGVGLSHGGAGGLSGSTQRRLAAKETPLIRPVWLTALPRGECFVRMKGEVWKLRVPLLKPVSQNNLDMLGLSALWAGLDPKNIGEEDLCIPCED